MTTIPDACASTYTKANAGDAVVVCGSPGEIANDPIGTNTFQLAGSTNLKFAHDFLQQKKNAWTMAAMYSDDHLRQR